MPSQPRPILKRLSSANKQANSALPFAMCGRNLSPHVHFPPTPSMVASTHLVHSPQTYDRKPIAVSPDSDSRHRTARFYSPPADFEVEHRGRGRDRSSASDHVKGSYFHPRAYEACELEPLDTESSHMSPPLLVADAEDYASDTDEEFVTTPPDPKLPTVSNTVACPASPLCQRPGSPFRSIYTSTAGQKSDDELPRPALLRSKPPSLMRTVRFQLQDRLSGVDEACLGGF